MSAQTAATEPPPLVPPLLTLILSLAVGLDLFVLGRMLGLLP